MTEDSHKEPAYLIVVDEPEGERLLSQTEAQELVDRIHTGDKGAIEADVPGKGPGEKSSNFIDDIAYELAGIGEAVRENMPEMKEALGDLIDDLKGLGNAIQNGDVGGVIKVIFGTSGDSREGVSENATDASAGVPVEQLDSANAVDNAEGHGVDQANALPAEDLARLNEILDDLKQAFDLHPEADFSQVSEKIDELADKLEAEMEGHVGQPEVSLDKTPDNMADVGSIEEAQGGPVHLIVEDGPDGERLLSQEEANELVARLNSDKEGSDKSPDVARDGNNIEAALKDFADSGVESGGDIGSPPIAVEGSEESLSRG